MSSRIDASSAPLRPSQGAEECRHEHHHDAQRRRVDTCREVAVTKQKIKEGGCVEEDRPMHQGRVLERAVGVEVVGIARVQALVMAHHALAE